MTNIRLICDACGAPITHIEKLDYGDSDYGHIYKCDYCGTRYYIEDDTLKKYYELSLTPQPLIVSVSTTSWSSGHNNIIDLIIAFIITAILFPIALSQVSGKSNSNWYPTIITLYPVVAPIAITLGIMVYGFREFR